MIHKKHILITTMLVFALITLAAVGIAYGQGKDDPNSANQSSEGNGIQSPVGVNAVPNGKISYQGRLILNGSPVNGTINITFRLYDASTAGTLVWSETQSVTVNNGLFSIYLGSVNPLTAHPQDFVDQLWLGIQPAGAAAELTPRQQLGTAAYAFNLVPGSTMFDANPAGIYGWSFWVQSTNHGAIYGQSDKEDGVTGVSTAQNKSGVYGINTTGGASSNGVEGVAGGTATVSCSTWASAGDPCITGVNSVTTGDAYGIMSSSARASIMGRTTTTSYYTGWFYSTLYPNAYGIYSNGQSVFDDYVIFNGLKSGYVGDIAYNDGAEALEKGDVVVISGYDTAVVGNIPVIKVQKATSATATGVVGIVDVLYTPCDTNQSLEAGQACGGFETDVTTIQPGQYLSVVTLGSYMGVKASAVNGAIKPGDLLSVDATLNGVAAKAQTTSVNGVEFVVPGTSFGKALGGLDSGTGLIPVFVTIR